MDLAQQVAVRAIEVRGYDPAQGRFVHLRNESLGALEAARS